MLYTNPIGCSERYKHQPFREFLQEFEVLQGRAESGGRSWSESTKIMALAKTLHPDLAYQLINVRGQPTDDYDAYVKMVADISANV